MKKHFIPIILAATLIITFAVWRTTPAPQYPAAAIHSALPDPSTAKLALNSMSRHREWVMAPSEAGGVLAFVVYPERSDKAPVVIISEKVRAIGRGRRRIKWRQKAISPWSPTNSREQERMAATLIRTQRRPR
jgi:hypothetical protein